MLLQFDPVGIEHSFLRAYPQARKGRGPLDADHIRRGELKRLAMAYVILPNRLKKEPARFHSRIKRKRMVALSTM